MDESITGSICRGLAYLQALAHETAVTKGWWDEPPRNIGEQLALIHSELSEALEEYRSGRPLAQTYLEDDGKPCGFPVELADVLIRIADTCEVYHIDLGQAVLMKLRYNETRPYRHGGKKA